MNASELIEKESAMVVGSSVWLGLLLWSLFVGLLLCAALYSLWSGWSMWGGSFPWENGEPKQRDGLKNDDDSKPHN
jgi:hypothetical protein